MKTILFLLTAFGFSMPVHANPSPYDELLNARPEDKLSKRRQRKHEMEVVLGKKPVHWGPILPKFVGEGDPKPTSEELLRDFLGNGPPRPIPPELLDEIVPEPKPIPEEKLAEWDKNPALAVPEVFERKIYADVQPADYLGDFFEKYPHRIMSESFQMALLTELNSDRVKNELKLRPEYLLGRKQTVPTIPEIISNIKSDNPKLIEQLLILAKDPSGKFPRERVPYRVVAVKALAQNQVSDPSVHERLARIITNEADTANEHDADFRDRQELNKAKTGEYGWWGGLKREWAIEKRLKQRRSPDEFPYGPLKTLDSWEVFLAIERALLTDMPVSDQIKTEVQQAMSQLKPHYAQHYQKSHEKYMDLEERIRSRFSKPSCRKTFGSDWLVAPGLIML